MKNDILKLICRFFYLLIPCLLIAYTIQYKMNNAAQNCGWNYTCVPVGNAHMDSINADIVIFGNSRAQQHYMPLVMDSVLGKKVFNLGLSGYSFDFQWNLIIQPYLKRNKKPQLIIQDISCGAFLGHANPDYDAGYLPFLNYEGFDFYIKLCPELSIWDKWLPTRYRGITPTKLWEKYDTYTIPSTRDVFYDGFAYNKSPKYNVNFSKHKLDDDPSIISDLKLFMDLCEKDSIPLLFVYSPQHYQDVSMQAEMDSFWIQIHDIIGAHNVEVWDYSNMFGSDTTYFAEATHMNKQGADSFSYVVAERVYKSFFDNNSDWNVKYE